MSILIVDGNWLAARAAFALPESIRSRSGEPLNVVYGFFKALTSDLRSAQPTILAVAFDAHGQTFRHGIYGSYKSGRVALPESFDKQLGEIKSMLDALETPRCEIELLEADDLIASWSCLAAKDGMEVTILSGDRDVAQLVEDPLVRLLPRWKRDGTKSIGTLDEEGIYNQFGVWPREYVLYASLRGDRSDNLPGIPGVGPKTAAKLVRRFGSLDAMLEMSNELPIKAADALRKSAAAMRLNINLITLVRDAAVPWPLIPFAGQNLWEGRLRELFEAVGLPMGTLPTGATTTEKSSSTIISGANSSPRSVRRICLISCAARKSTQRLPAEDLYTSTLFRKSRGWAERMADAWYILSAKHGLVTPKTKLAPYNLSLKDLSGEEIAIWASRVTSALKTKLTPGDVVTLLAGKTYIAPIEQWLRSAGVHIYMPLEGRSMGVRQRWLSHSLMAPDMEQHLERFYELLSHLRTGLGGPRYLQNCDARMGWPKRGVYFFLEPAEPRVGRPELRVTRVGTHAVGRGAKSSLWGRLRTHRGIGRGGGSHRSSVFRLHVGAAMIAQRAAGQRYQNWGGLPPSTPEDRAHEMELEIDVSCHIGLMEVLPVDIDDPPSPDSDRAYIERNAIALLSSTGVLVDPPTGTWLGLDSPYPEIRRTGLWNLQHSETNLDIRFLDVLESYIEVTLGHRPPPAKSIAPEGWWKQQVRSDHRQLNLFEGGQ